MGRCWVGRMSNWAGESHLSASFLGIGSGIVQCNYCRFVLITRGSDATHENILVPRYGIRDINKYEMHRVGVDNGRSSLRKSL